MLIYIVRTDGRIDERECSPLQSTEVIRKEIKAEGTTVVNLRDGRVMVIDDVGHIEGKPINPFASRLYWTVCKPGTTHPIAGDVAVCNDVDFDLSTHVTGFRSKPAAPPMRPAIVAGHSEEPTPYMVRCRTHGDVYLTEHEYDRQMTAADSLWVCPICLQLATWDDANYEAAMEKLTAPERGEAPEGDSHE